MAKTTKSLRKSCCIRGLAYRGGVLVQLVHLILVRLLELLLAFLLAFHRRFALVDEQFRVVGILLADPPVFFSLRLQIFVRLNLARRVHRRPGLGDLQFFVLPGKIKDEIKPLSFGRFSLRMTHFSNWANKSFICWACEFSMSFFKRSVCTARCCFMVSHSSLRCLSIMSDLKKDMVTNLPNLATIRVAAKGIFFKKSKSKDNRRFKFN